MNDYNQTLAVLRSSKEIIEKVLPGITNPDVKKSLINKKEGLNEEIKSMLNGRNDYV